MIGDVVGCEGCGEEFVQVLPDGKKNFLMCESCRYEAKCLDDDNCHYLDHDYSMNY